MFQRRVSQLRLISRLLSTKWYQPPPPSHFSNPSELPSAYPPQSFQQPSNPPPQTIPTHGQPSTQGPHSPSLSQPSLNQASGTSRDGTSGGDTFNHFRELSSLLAMAALAYFAVDNYTERLKLEKLHAETTAINLKALQIQQANFSANSKTRDLQILQERKENAKRSFKMSLHIALLRKQLIELGYDPIELEAAIKEFEKNVRADNSSKNVMAQFLWLDDSSGMYAQHINGKEPAVLLTFNL